MPIALMEKLPLTLEIIALSPEVSRFNRYMTLPVNCKLGPSDTQQHIPQTSTPTACIKFESQRPGTG
jgi:hypothetical protein